MAEGIPELLGLHHVTAIAGDAQRNLDFYTGFLGLRLVKRTVNFDDPGTHHFYFGNRTGDPGTLLTFFPWGHIRKPRKGPGQAVAVAFRVMENTLGYWERRAAASGVIARRLPDRFGQAVLAMEDPDGLVIELIELIGASDSDEGTGLRQLAGVTLLVSETESAAALLGNVLGLTAAGRESDRSRFLLPGGAHIDLLHPSEGSKPESGKMGAGIVHHVALRVADGDSLSRWRARIVAGGLRVSQKKDRGYFESIYFRQPFEGSPTQLFELATDGPGFLIDEPVSELGTRLSLPPWLEPHRDELEARLPSLAVPGTAVWNESAASRDSSVASPEGE